MSISLSLDTPLLSLPEYARRTGITIDSVRKQCDKGHLPFIQAEERGTKYINMAKLYQNCIEADSDKPHNQCSFS